MDDDLQCLVMVSVGIGMVLECNAFMFLVNLHVRLTLM